MDHHHHLQLTIVCVFVITCKIAHGQLFSDFGFGLDDFGFDDDNGINQNPPYGYHYESITEVLQNYDPTTYTIMPMSTTMLANGRGQGRGSRKKSTADNDNDGMPDEEAGGDNEADNGENQRRKRGFFDFHMPFTSEDNTAAASATAAASSTTATSTDETIKEEVSVNTKVTEDGTEVDKEMTEVKTASTNATDSSMTTNSLTTDPGLLTNTGSMVMDIISIGKDIEDSMIVAAPYLPLIWKVATFIVPGLQPFQMLTLSVNVASITMHVLQNYMAGHSMPSIATEAMYEAVRLSLSKRDTGAAFSDYASNLYDSLKKAFSAHFSSRFFSSSDNSENTIANNLETPETSNNDDPIGTLENVNNVNTIETTVTKTYVNGVEMPETSETQTIVTKTNKNGVIVNNQITQNQLKLDKASSEEANDKLKKTELVNKIIKTGVIKKKVINMKNQENSNENSSCASENSNNSSDESVEVDETRFNQLLEESMKLQPEFIQKKSGEELIEYLNNLKIDLPSPRIDTRQTFELLTDIMEFDEDVTEEQINKLNDVLSKATDYFISRALQNNPELN